MKPLFRHSLVNNSFGDPCLYVRLLRERYSLLFDLGDISALTPAQMNRITDVFVTHMHMDHFIGFDLLLRKRLRKESPLAIYGPPGIIQCVWGKLQGYTWNLIEEYPTVINVFSFDGQEIEHVTFLAKKRFSPGRSVRTASDGILAMNPLFRVRAAVIDHGIPCLAFSLTEDYHINIDKDRLMRRGLSVGPWLAAFKRLIRERAPSEQTIIADGKTCSLGDLAEIARITKGQKIAYVTDVGISEKNIAIVVDLVSGADVLYCEAYYLEEDRERAAGRDHLTARECGRIARSAGVKWLEVMHFSPLYKKYPERVIREAEEAFQGGSSGGSSG
jgi:ribonuclease Z